jgi:hypothetical protein
MASPTIADELAAIDTIYKALEPLSDEARLRIVTYVTGLLEISAPIAPAAASPPAPAPIDVTPEERAKLAHEEAVAPKFATFAELFDAATPNGNSEKALVVGYWLQVCGGAEHFDGFTANRELKNLGHGLGNVTNAVETLRNQTPALALQLSKAGKSQQARKTYKLTVAGIKAVEAMISG